jgi:hypothetical protein
MATERNPSIYYDRGTIGSSDELDEYGVWVKIEPQDLYSDTLQTDEAVDFTENTIGGNISLDDIPDSVGFDDTDFGSVGFEDTDFDNTGLGGLEAPASPEDDQVPQSPADKTEIPDLSTQLLMKIAEELASIKSELSSLKEELSVIRSERPVSPALNTAEGGFFDEEDDEKIALTGDELNNIIHTADFTEEAGADAGESFTDDYIPPEFYSSGDKNGEDPAAFGDSIPQGEDFLDLSKETQDEIVYDGLGRPINVKFSGSSGGEDPASTDTGIGESSPADTPTEDPTESGDNSLQGENSMEEPQEIIYDGLGRPINPQFSDSSVNAVIPELAIDSLLELKDSEDLKILREEGAVPITPAPEDTSYLEEDPLVVPLEEASLGESQGDELLDLTDAVIDEPDLSGDLNEPPLEEPSLDNLSLIDLDNMENISDETAEDTLSEDNVFEEVSFDEDFSQGESIDLSDFDEPISENDGGILPDITGADLNFEMIPEDAELPVQENMQNNVITEDSFNPIAWDDAGEESFALSPDTEISEGDADSGSGDAQIDEELEQTLPEGTTIALDLPPLELPYTEIDEFFKESGLDDLNFNDPGAVVTADAGDPVDTDPGSFSDADFPESAPEDSVIFSEEDTIPGDEPEDMSDLIEAKVPVELSDDFSMEIPGDFTVESVPEFPAENVSELPVINTGETDGEILTEEMPSKLKKELKNVLSYMDKLLESLPEDKIEEFAKSDYFDTYKKLFEELGIK